MFRSSSMAQRKINRLILSLTPSSQVLIHSTSQKAGCHSSAKIWENWQQICHHWGLAPSWDNLQLTVGLSADHPKPACGASPMLQGPWCRAGWKLICNWEPAAVIIQQVSLSEVRVADPLCLPSNRIPFTCGSWLRVVTSTMLWTRRSWSSLSHDYWREH